MQRTEFDRLVAEARTAAAAYYNGGTPTMTDSAYDLLVDRIGEAAAAHGWDAGGILDRVAAGASTGGTVTHPDAMLSLNKVKTVADAAAFTAGIGGPAVVEPKLDGMAVRAEYVDGRLALIATRGDGNTGEDVTAGADRIAGLPATIPLAGRVEVRGEVFMTDADFDTANSNRIAAGHTGFANPRNATAGSLRRDTNDYPTPMSFAAYAASGDGLQQDSHTDRMAALAAAGIRTALGLLADQQIPTGPTGDPAATADRIGQIGAARPHLGYPIDGAVVKADRETDRARLGNASRHPRWAVCCKYAADTATTTVTAIHTTIGRTGRLGIQLEVDPTDVGGTTITYAAGHNVPWMQAQNIGVGTRVSLYRAGDVIPRAVALPDDQQDPHVAAWTPPAGCPQCDGPWDTSSLLWRCTNPECSILGWIGYVCSRDLWDVEGASDAVVTALVDGGLVNDPADLFALTVDQLAALPLGTTSSGAVRRLGQLNAAKIHAGIQRAKAAPLARTISALNIRGTGRTMGRRLAARFPTMSALQAASPADLSQVDGVGAEKAALIHAGLRQREALIGRLAAAGVNMGEAASGPAAGPSGAPLAGLKVVVTGSMAGEPRLAGLNRNDMNTLIESCGGTSSSSVSKATGLLVCGETGSSKHTKATALGVRIVTPAEFADLIGL